MFYVILESDIFTATDEWITTSISFGQFLSFFFSQKE